MTAELRKLLAMPTPRWTLLAVVFGAVVAIVVAALAGPGEGKDMMPVQLGVGLATSVGAIVLGAWMIGVEYGQRTLRRALSADPSRARLVLTKLAVGLGAITVVTLLISVVTAPVFSAIASAHGESMSFAAQLQYGLAALANNLIYATVAFALALFTRSMAGGMSLALVFAFVIDTLMSAIPAVGDYALGTGVVGLMTEISGIAIGGIQESGPSLLMALVITSGWLVAMLGISVTRFMRTDVE
jgi:ABC-type transport system involved in multi-copper enzyme maturation permease subunit